MTTAFVAALTALSGKSAEFGYMVDHGRASECRACFTQDEKLIFAAGSLRPGTIEGIDAIRAFLDSRQTQTHVTTRHQATNFRIQWDGGTEATLDSLLTVFRSDTETRQPVVSIVADIREIFTRSAGGHWLIRERTITPIFVHTT